VDGDNSILNEIALHLKQKQRGGRCKYSNHSTIYPLHIDDIHQSWLLRSNLDPNLWESSFKAKQSLLGYVIVSKNFHPTPELPAIKPQLVFKASSNNENIHASKNTLMEEEKVKFFGIFY